MWYSTVWNSINNLLTSLIATTTLTAVYNYDVKDSNSFPFTTISMKSGSEKELDTSTNEASYELVIRVVDMNKVVSSMEPRMRLLCDNIIAELRKLNNQTLAGTVINILPITTSWGWYDWQQAPSRVCEITLTIREIFTI